MGMRLSAEKLKALRDYVGELRHRRNCAGWELMGECTCELNARLEIKLLLDDYERLIRENRQMRMIIANSGMDCIYCGLPKNDMAKCQQDFPGCSRAGDLMP